MRESFKKNKIGILLMLISSFCVCIGQLFWKLSSHQGIPFLLLGFILYGFGAIIMVIAYRHGKLSVLQPMLSLNYIISVILASVLLNEPVTILKVIGVIVIMIGVVLICGGDEE